MSKVKKKVKARIAKVKADQRDPDGSKRKAAMGKAPGAVPAAMLGHHIGERLDMSLSNADFQRLARVFGNGCDLRTTQDSNINEWLKAELTSRASPCTCRRAPAAEIDKDPDCPLGDHA